MMEESKSEVEGMCVEVLEGVSDPEVRIRDGKVEIAPRCIVRVGGGQKLLEALRVENATLSLSLIRYLLDAVTILARSDNGRAASRLRAQGDDLLECVFSLAEVQSEIQPIAMKCVGALLAPRIDAYYFFRLFQLVVGSSRLEALDALMEACLLKEEDVFFYIENRSLRRVGSPKRILDVGSEKPLEMALVAETWPFLENEAYISFWTRPLRLENRILLFEMRTLKDGGMQIEANNDAVIARLSSEDAGEAWEISSKSPLKQRCWTHIGLSLRKVKKNNSEDANLLKHVIVLKKKKKTKDLRVLELSIHGKIVANTLVENLDISNSSKVRCATLGHRFQGSFAGLVVLNRVPKHTSALALDVCFRTASSLTADASCGLVSTRIPCSNDETISNDDVSTLIAKAMHSQVSAIEALSACAASCLQGPNNDPLGALVYEPSRVFEYKSCDDAIAHYGGIALLMPLFAQLSCPRLNSSNDLRIGPRLGLLAAALRHSHLCHEFYTSAGVDIVERCLAVRTQYNIDDLDAAQIAIALTELLDTTKQYHPPLAAALTKKVAFQPFLWSSHHLILNALHCFAHENQELFDTSIGLYAYLNRLAQLEDPHLLYAPRYTERSKETEPISDQSSRPEDESDHLKPARLIPLQLPRSQPRQREVDDGSRRKARLDALAHIIQKLYTLDERHSRIEPPPAFIVKFREDALSFVMNNTDDEAVGRLVDAIVAVCADDDDALAPLLMERVVRKRLDLGDSASVVALAKLLKKTKRHRLFADALCHTKACVADAAYTAFLQACVDEDPLLALDITATLLSADRLGTEAVTNFISFILKHAKTIAKPGLTSRAFDAAYLALVARSLRRKQRQKKKGKKPLSADTIHNDIENEESFHEATYQLLLSSVRCARTEALNNEAQALELAAALADESCTPSILLRLTEDICLEFKTNEDLRSNMLKALPCLVALAPRFKHAKQPDEQIVSSSSSSSKDIEPGIEATERPVKEASMSIEVVDEATAVDKEILVEDESTLTVKIQDEDEDAEEVQSQDSLAVASLEVTGQADFFEADEDDDEDDVQIVKIEIAHSQVDDLRLAVSLANMCRTLLLEKDIRNIMAWDAAMCVLIYLVRKRSNIDDAQLLAALLRKASDMHPDEARLGRRALMALDAAHTALRGLGVSSTNFEQNRLAHADELYGILIEGARIVTSCSRSSSRNKLILPRAAMDALVAMLADAARVPSNGPASTHIDEEGKPDVSSDEKTTPLKPTSSWILRSKRSGTNGRLSPTAPINTASKCEKLLVGLEGRGCRHSWLASQWLADDLATALAAVDPRADSTAWGDAQSADARTSASVRANLRTALTNARRLGESSWSAIPRSAPEARREDAKNIVVVRSDRSDRAWRACAKLLRAEWSPWCADEPSTLRRYRVSVRVDRFGRRPILERDYEPRDFAAAAYSSRHQRTIDEEMASPNKTKTEMTLDRPRSPESTADENHIVNELAQDQNSSDEDDNQPGGSFVVVEPNSNSKNTERRLTSHKTKTLMTAASARKHAGDVEIRRRWEPVARFQDTILVQPNGAIKGMLKVTRFALIFESVDTQITRTIRLAAIERLAPRRYLLQHRALEVWRINGTSILLALKNIDKSKELWQTLSQLWRRGSIPLAQTEVFHMIDLDALYESARHTSGAVPSPDFAASKHLPLAASVDEVVHRHLSKLTEAWRRRKISNFTYIAALNDIAGRNYSDIAQWPIFPWVLADFESDREAFLVFDRRPTTRKRISSADGQKAIKKRSSPSSSWKWTPPPTSSDADIETDEASLREEEVFFGASSAATTAVVQSAQQTEIADENIQGGASPRRHRTRIRDRYRDLTKPMGAHGPRSRLEAFEERYRSFEDPTGDVPKFMYGSHYSSAAIVVHFLVRVQPFAELAVQLQGKTFDVPDRLFHSVSESWKSATESMCDVKELVPEMFYLPEIFLNENILPLGARQRPPEKDGDNQSDDDAETYAVDAVALPPWAQNDAHEFIRLHRLALESDYVSDHLHAWIDLVFGVKQRGPRAVAATNVFYHLTYENAVDVDAIQDDDSKTAILEQIRHFGQTPPQILSVAHPTRLPAAACPAPLFGPIRGHPRETKPSSSSRESIRVYKVPPPPQLPEAVGLPYGELSARLSSSSTGLFGDIRRVLSGAHSNTTMRDAFNGTTLSKQQMRSLMKRGAAVAIAIALPTAPAASSNALFAMARKPHTATTNAESNDAKGASTTPSAATVTTSSGPSASSTNTPSPAAAALASSSSKGHAHPRLVACFEDRSIAAWRWSSEIPDGKGLPFTAKVDTKRSNIRLAKVPRVADRSTAASTVAFLCGGELIASVDYADGRLRLHEVVSGRSLAWPTRNGHRGAITHLAADEKDPASLLITGADDGTLCVWTVHQAALADALQYADDSDDDGDFFFQQLGLDAKGWHYDNENDILLQSAPPASLHPELFEVNTTEHRRTKDVNVWDRGPPILAPSRATVQKSSKPLLLCSHKLWGHRSAISSIAYCANLDIVVSGSNDGACCIHTVKSGRFIRRIEKCCESRINTIALVEASCEFIAHASKTRELALITLNGARRTRVAIGQHSTVPQNNSRFVSRLFPLKSVTDETQKSAHQDQNEIINAPRGHYVTMRATRDGTRLVCANIDLCRLDIRITHSLRLHQIVDISSYGAPLSLTFSPDDRHLFVATDDGSLLVCADPHGSLQQLDVALTNTILGISSIWDPF